jgi:hypothetical protein
MPTADVAIITAIYDNYDSLKPVCEQSGINAEWIVVTDNPGLEAPGYLKFIVQYRKELPYSHPNRHAKYPKLFPWEFTPAPASIWIDASFKVTSPDFAVEALSYAQPIAQFKHPWRDCIYDEAIASIGIPKYAGEPIDKQSGHYSSLGFPEHFGLWATGVIARQHTKEVQNHSKVWNVEIAAGSFQDQLSEPVAFWTAGLRPIEFPGTHFSNKWLSYEGSGRH